jgi:succinyl-CoA synthetase alpha subunit
MIFVPARFARRRDLRGRRRRHRDRDLHRRGPSAHEMLRIYNYIRPRGVTMLGPELPGALSPGKANVGIIPAEIFTEGTSASSPAPARSPTRSGTS